MLNMFDIGWQKLARGSSSKFVFHKFTHFIYTIATPREEGLANKQINNQSNNKKQNNTSKQNVNSHNKTENIAKKKKTIKQDKDTG